MAKTSMSGLWSFREPNFTTADAGRGSHDARRVPHLVTHVLPTGVEYRRSLLSRPSSVERPTASTAVPSTSVQDQSCINTRETQRSTHIDTDSTEGAMAGDVPVLSGCPTKDILHDQQLLTLAKEEDSVGWAGRDEAVSEVQRNWWRSLNVDVAPSVYLPSSILADLDKSAFGGGDAGAAEARQTAHLLVARVASLNDASSGSRTNAGATSAARCYWRHPPRDSRELSDARLLKQEKRKHVCLDQREGCRSCGFRQLHPTAQRRSVQRTGDRRHGEQPMEHCVGTATGAVARHVRETPSSALVGRTHEAAVVRQDSTLSASPSYTTDVLPAEQCLTGTCTAATPNGGAISTLAGSPAAEYLDKSLPMLMSPSEPLQKAAGAASVTASSSRNDDTQRGAEKLACANTNARVVLGHYFTLWLSVVEERRIQRSAASYHHYLLQCVRDTLAEPSLV